MTNVLGASACSNSAVGYVPPAGDSRRLGRTVLKVEHPVQGDPIRGLVSRR
jgi:hypothetical protein